jgi:hypothetical protein
MTEIRSQARLEEMRRRLYERGAVIDPEPRHSMEKNPDIVTEKWVQPKPVRPEPAFDPRPPVLTEPTVEVHEPAPEKKKSGWSFRAIILLAALGIFLLTLGVSTLYLLFGNTQISTKNITITMSGPLTVGGGETMPITVNVTNQNKTAIESVVLVMKYPAGTKSADGTSKDLLSERIPLNSIKPGESINVPVKAQMFGEENQEHDVNATVEYHLVDSNGTFYKDAEPLKFKINSSPLVISVDALNKVSAGQSVDVTLTIKSNATTPLEHLLISANYPNNFDFTSASPVPSYRESEWTIKELKPGETTTIKIKGTIVGQQAETFQMQFSAGTPEQNNEFTIGSVLAKSSTDFVIEQPFINVGMTVNANPKTDVVTLQTGDETKVSVTVQNTLEESLYDMALEVAVKGNILVRESVSVQKGFYDSTKDVIRFDPSGDTSLSQIAPGATKTFTFSLRPSKQTATPSFTITANAFARRVNEDRATEHLVGTAKTEVKFTSSVSVDRAVSRRVSGIPDAGPIPPVADTETTYAVTLKASAGGNDVSDAVVVTSLPQYVNWKNLSVGDGTLAFNPISKELTWTIGDITAGVVKQTTFQIGLLPSQNQIGTTPAVLGAQRMRATDRFTGAVIRAENVPASSELDPSTGYEAENGKVLKTSL